MKPEVKNSRLVYEGKVFKVLIDEIVEAGISYNREMVIHNGSSVIVPVFDDKTVALVKQYRHPAGKYLVEIPAGSIENDETPEECARRELEEEIGVRAGKLEKLTEFFVSPGFLSEKMHVFLATELKPTKQKPEFDELLQIKRLDFEQLFKMIKNCEIEDAKTMLGVLLAGIKLNLL
ncbi:MAG: NUDIX hydrolase [Pyrinomonadaceae bacterium]|nr:NUDIX hydrolase [Pyrinomonadaceae bacterium]MCX7639097.1 NUDIX hydrolase [Pyrinomonadaceae bacterium]MDW8303682.1 NUDIX hydrolase [Acidobacteriota bacterium]